MSFIYLILTADVFINAMETYENYTSETVVVQTDIDTFRFPSKGVARVEKIHCEPATEHGGIQIRKNPSYSSVVVGLPVQREGVKLIVSTDVAICIDSNARLLEVQPRADLVCPDHNLRDDGKYRGFITV